MSDNEYTPWEQLGETELAYYKRLFLGESAEVDGLQARIAAYEAGVERDGEKIDRLEQVILRQQAALGAARERCQGIIESSIYPTEARGVAWQILQIVGEVKHE